MNKLSGGSLLVAGIFLVIFGVVVQSGIIETLLDIIGFIIIVGGVIVGIIGLVSMLSGNKGSASDSDW